jgi:cytochrome c oxidase assembly protein Cox11
VAFFGMVGAAYAAVPLYKLFCQATGFDGTVRKAVAKPTKVLDRKVEIRFDANVRNLPWDFQAMQVSQDIRIGDTGLAFFKVTNKGDKPLTGRALYNVVPEQAGPYFQKLECFCFSNQTIEPGQTVEFPVVYFVDPGFVTDPDTKGKSDDHAVLHLLPGGSGRGRGETGGDEPAAHRRTPWRQAAEGAIAFHTGRVGRGNRVDALDLQGESVRVAETASTFGDHALEGLKG